MLAGADGCDDAAAAAAMRMACFDFLPLYFAGADGTLKTRLELNIGCALYGNEHLL